MQFTNLHTYAQTAKTLLLGPQIHRFRCGIREMGGKSENVINPKQTECEKSCSCTKSRNPLKCQRTRNCDSTFFIIFLFTPKHLMNFVAGNRVLYVFNLSQVESSSPDFRCSFCLHCTFDSSSCRFKFTFSLVAVLLTIGWAHANDILPVCEKRTQVHKERPPLLDPAQRSQIPFSGTYKQVRRLENISS